MRNFVKLVLLVVITFNSFGMICCLRNSSSDLFLNNNGTNESNDNVPDNEKTQDKLFQERINKLLAILFCWCLFIGGNIEMLFFMESYLKTIKEVALNWK